MTKAKHESPEIESLNLEDLSVDELEFRLDLAVATFGDIWKDDSLCEAPCNNLPIRSSVVPELSSSSVAGGAFSLGGILLYLKERGKKKT